jgi:GT2 family glycosyltransferase
MNLSIIIVSFNTRDLLKKCLDSLPSSSEIIVIDNGSIDGTVAMVKEIKESKIKIIENKENVGFVKAVNQGLKQAEGEYLLLLNSDIFVKNNALEKLITFAKDQPRTGVIGGKLINPDGSLQGSCFYLPTITRIIKEFWFNGPSSLTKYAPLGDKPAEVEAVSGAVFLIPKKVLHKVGFFDERYFMYFEDLDYCRRVRQAGFKVYYLPEAEFIHEHGASGRSIPQKTHRWLVESSKVYHGVIKYYLITFIIWSGQKCQKILKKK